MPRMSSQDQKKGRVTDEHRQEASRLRAIWEQTKAARAAAGVASQESFGDRYGIGNQAAVGFFLNGKTALSLKAAHGFAKGLGCSIEDFSPRLARMAHLESKDSVPSAGQLVPATGASLPQPAVAHDVSQFIPEDSPLIPWEKLTMGAKIPSRFWTDLPDDSMGPRWPKGTRVLVDADVQPQGGEAVVVMDAAGGAYFRRYVRRSGSRWYAEALADGYARLDSEDDGLRLVGVAIAVWGRLMA